MKRYSSSLLNLGLLCALGTSCCSAFAPLSIKSNHLRNSITELEMAQPKATLTESSTWRLRFSLNGVPTKNGRKVGELFNVDVQFIEDEGYGESSSMFISANRYAHY